MRTDGGVRSRSHTNDLSVHCDREQIPYIPFETFDKVKDIIARIVEGKSTIDEELKRK